jgi:hypothetical protein
VDFYSLASIMAFLIKFLFHDLVLIAVLWTHSVAIEATTITRVNNACYTSQNSTYVEHGT